MFRFLEFDDLQREGLSAHVCEQFLVGLHGGIESLTLQPRDYEILRKGFEARVMQALTVIQPDPSGRFPFFAYASRKPLDVLEPTDLRYGMFGGGFAFSVMGDAPTPDWFEVMGKIRASIPPSSVQPFSVAFPFPFSNPCMAFSAREGAVAFEDPGSVYFGQRAQDYFQKLVLAHASALTYGPDVLERL